jgi:MFS family permease
MWSDPVSSSRLRQVLALGVTQTIAWASSTYLPAILAQPIAADMGISASTVFGAFSVSLIVMAVAGPPVGRTIDRKGGRGMLAMANLVLAAGLVFLGLAPSAEAVFAAWCVLGVGMAMGLYDAAFATLVRLHGATARTPITGVTLIAGFASTVGWPLTAFIAEQFGWREACFGWAALNVVVALPLNLLCIPSVAREAHGDDRAVSTGAGAAEGKARPGWRLPGERRAFVLLAFFSAATAFVTSAMAAHLPGLLLAAGATTVAALTAAALLGPAQVAARLAEFLAAHRFKFHPLLTARIATALHPVGAVVLGTFGGAPLAVSGFAVLHGAGNGMITIAKGTLPLAIFGAAGYGLLQGLLGILARAMQALAPYAFGLVLEAFGVRAAISLSAGLSLAALAALFGLRARSRQPT